MTGEAASRGRSPKDTNKKGKKPKIQTDRKAVADKLYRYLLNPDHKDGGPKSRYFEESLGYSRRNLNEFAEQLAFDVSTAQKTEVTQYGTKYNQEIEIISADGTKSRIINTGWIIKSGKKRATLITAIPPKKDKKNV